MAGSRTRALHHPRYQILRRLGAGGTSSVFLAKDRLDEGREVALKICHLQVSPEEILREFRILRQLRHPGIARAFDCGRMPDSGSAYFTLESIPGQNLEEHTRALRRGGGQQAVGRIISLFLQAASTLSYLHEKGLLHLDIKPANLVLSDDRVKLIDFGLFQTTQVENSLPPRGTVSYMAPEVIDGGPIDHRADIYSLGAAIFHSLTGRVPIPGRTVEEIASNQRTFVPPPPRGMHEGLSRVILKMLAKSPRHRFQSSREVAIALRGAMPDVVEVQEPSFDEPDFVGRRQEIDALFDWLEGIKRGQGPRLLLLEGEAGVGKTRLVEACATEMLDLSTQVVPIQTQGGKGRDGLKQLMEKLLVLHPISQEEERQSRFLLNYLGIARDTRSLQEIADLDLASIQARVTHSALELLAGRASKPLIFVMDDLGESDTELLRFLSSLSRAKGTEGRPLRVGVLATRRPPESPRNTSSDLDTAEARLLSVRCLPRADGIAILACVAPELSEAEASRRVKSTRGNPGVLLERLRASRMPGGAGEKSSLHQTPASMALEAAYRARTMALGDEDRTTILTFALAEKPLGDLATRGIAKLARGKWAAVIRRLSRSGLVGGSKAARHILHGARAAVASCFAADEIRSMHGRIGSHLLKDSRNLREAAHHLLRGGDLRLGLQTAERSADSLRAAGRIEEALSVLREALGQLEPGLDRARHLERLGELEEKCGRFDAAASAFQDALSFWPGKSVARLRLLRKLGGIHQRRGNNESASGAFEEAQCLAESVSDIGEQLYLLQELSAFHLFRGEFANASTFANRGLELLSSDGARRLRKEARAHHSLDFHSAAGHIFLRQFEYEQASKQLLQGLKHAEKLGAVSSAALLWNNLGIAFGQDNRLQESLAAYRRATELSRDIGDTTAVFSIQCNMATLRARLGESQAAEEALRIAEAMPQAASSLRAKLFLTHSRGLVERILLRDAEPLWKLAIKIADEIPDPLFAAYGRLCWLENELQFGRWESARALGDRLSSLKGKDPRFDRALGARLACLAALCGQREEARAIIEYSFQAQGAALYADLWDSVYHAQALLELGDLESAEAILTRARVAFESSHQSPSALECDLLLADLELRRRDAPAAARHLRSASKSLAAHDSPGGSRRANVRLPYLEARAELISMRGDRGALEDRLADAAGSLEAHSTAEIVWLLALVAAETGNPARRRKASALEKAFAAHLTPRDRESYVARDHRARLGLILPVGAGGVDPSHVLGARRYEALLRLSQAHAPSHALKVVIDAVGARAGAIFLSDVPRAAAAHGLGKRSESEIENLRRQALGASPGKQEGAIHIAIRGESSARGTLYIDPGPNPLDVEAIRFLEASAALLVNLIPSATPGREALHASTRSLSAIQHNTMALLPTAYGQTKSPRMKDLLDLVLRTRGSELSVLIVGESGSGKDHLARWIHSMSPRSRGPFIAQDCASVPEGLLEADIFGYESGAFTGADHSKTGYIFAAHGGTYYLDNVDSLSLSVQAKLLRVLEEKSVRPLGGKVERRMDVRFIASSQRDLKELSFRGEFRGDLYYRLAGISLHVPPLRERAEDIPTLVRQIQRQLPGRPLEFEASAIHALKRYSWPGNVRELEAVVRRLAVTADGPVDEARMAQVLGFGNAGPSFPRWIFEGKTFDQAIDEVKREYLLDLFERQAGDLVAIAKEMRTTKRNVYFRFAQVGIKPVDLRGGGRAGANQVGRDGVRPGQ